jgi:glutamyl-tRNA reductase
VTVGDAPMGIVALVVHARHVPSEARERFAEAAALTARDPGVILLRTCHRVELYAAVEAGRTVDDPALRLPELPSGGRRLEDHDAIRHLFTVAAGLDSVVVGEDQILHQLRDCLAERHLPAFDASSEDCSSGRRPSLPAERPGELRPVLDRLFQLALHVGRRSRAWREGPPRSLADVALDRIEATAGQLAGRSILVVGAGRMSRLAALAAARRHAHVVVTNRTAERAAALAGDVDGSTVAFGACPDELAGVVAALAGPWDLGPQAERQLASGEYPVVDLSSPPCVGPDLRERLAARFVSVDDIARGPADALRDRLRRRIERLIDEADAELAGWIAGRGAVPAIRALTEHAEMRRAAEVERLLRRLPHLAEHDRALVEQMSHRLVAGLLHAPLASLRDDRSGEQDRAARDLFSL